MYHYDINFCSKSLELNKLDKRQNKNLRCHLYEEVIWRLYHLNLSQDKLNIHFLISLYNLN